jgi:hypothetical protein
MLSRLVCCLKKRKIPSDMEGFKEIVKSHIKSLKAEK